MRYKVGDKVRIREDLNEDVYYGGICAMDGMLDYRGVEVTILDVYEHYYLIKEDGGESGWTRDMFEDAFIKDVNKVEILFARKSKDVILPSKKDENAGIDIYAYFEEDFMIIPPHTTKMIPTGLYSCCSKDYYIQLLERGSTGTKGIAQRCGVIDSGFRGEWFVPITNTTGGNLVITKISNEETLKAISHNGLIKAGTILYPYTKAICQAVVLPVPKTIIKEISVEELQSIPSQRGDGCIGSSGK